MASMVAGQLPLEAGQPSPADIHTADTRNALPTKLDHGLHGRWSAPSGDWTAFIGRYSYCRYITMLYPQRKPYVKWTENEVAWMEVIENLKLAVVETFSYGWPNMDQLNRIIPAICGIKGFVLLRRVLK